MTENAHGSGGNIGRKRNAANSLEGVLQQTVCEKRTPTATIVSKLPKTRTFIFFPHDNKLHDRQLRKNLANQVLRYQYWACVSIKVCLYYAIHVPFPLSLSRFVEDNEDEIIKK